jgi:hypothetical protein
MCGSKGKKMKYANFSSPEKVAKTKLLQLHGNIAPVTNAILVIIMIIIYIGSFMIAIYYKYALGDAVALMGFIAGPVLVAFVVGRWPEIGISSFAIKISAIVYVVMGLLSLLYLASRSLELVNCNDPVQTGADAWFAAFCEANEGVLIGIIVFSAIVILVMFGLSIATCCMCKPARVYEDLVEVRKKKEKENKETKKET